MTCHSQEPGGTCLAVNGKRHSNHRQRQWPLRTRMMIIRHNLWSRRITQIYYSPCLAHPLSKGTTIQSWSHHILHPTMHNVTHQWQLKPRPPKQLHLQSKPICSRGENRRWLNPLPVNINLNANKLMGEELEGLPTRLTAILGLADVHDNKLRNSAPASYIRGSLHIDHRPGCSGLLPYVIRCGLGAFRDGPVPYHH